MESTKPWQLFLRLLVPLLWAAALHLSPRPAAYDAAQAAVWQARLQDNPTQESQALQVVTAFEPWRGDVWELIGELASQSQDWAGAATAYRQADQNGALTTSGREALGEAYWQQDDQANAIAAWQPLMRSGEAGPELFRKVVDDQRSRGDFDGAIQTLSFWKDAEPHNVQVIYDLGTLLLLDQPAKGLDLLKQAAGLDTDFTQAVYTLRQAFQVEPPSSLNQGQAVGRLGEWDLAAVFYRRAVTEDPNSAEAWAYLGEALDQAGESGTDAFQQALTLDPTSIPARAGAALHWRRQGNLDLALTYLKALAQEQPKQGVWQMEVGNTLAADGKLNDAMDYYQRALELEPRNAYYWSIVAGFCADNSYNLRATGLPAARQALLLAPNNPEYLDLMGALLMQLEDFTSAERFLQHALQMDAQLASAHLHLGQLYLSEGSPEPAYHSLMMAETLAGEKSNVGALAKRLLVHYFPGSIGASEPP